MKHLLSFACALLFGAILNASTRAACGGGGYTPAPQTSYHTADRTELPVSASYTPGTKSRQVIRAPQSPSATLDTNRFNEISSRLGMDNKQATEVINAMREIRIKEHAGQKDFNSREEFEKRLPQILTSNQYQTYLTGI